MASILSRLALPIMRAHVPLACVTLFAVVAGLPRDAAARRYTLPELIAKVNASYSGVQAAREGVEAADAQLSQATRLWWPTGQMTFSITGSPAIQWSRPTYKVDSTGNVVESGTVRDPSNRVATDVGGLRS